MTRVSLNIASAHHALASHIACARTAAGMTQTEVAVKIGRDQTFISKVESQERRLGVIEFVQITEAMCADPLAILKAVSLALHQKS